MLYFGGRTKAWFNGLDEATKKRIWLGSSIEAATDKVKIIRQACDIIKCTCDLNLLMLKGCTCVGK